MQTELTYLIKYVPNVDCNSRLTHSSAGCYSVTHTHATCIRTICMCLLFKRHICRDTTHVWQIQRTRSQLYRIHIQYDLELARGYMTSSAHKFTAWKYRICMPVRVRINGIRIYYRMVVYVSCIAACILNTRMGNASCHHYVAWVLSMLALDLLHFPQNRAQWQTQFFLALHCSQRFFFIIP